jgi:hypothetical protein
MNDCFDLVNSSSAYAKHPNKRAVTQSNLSQRVKLMKSNAAWISQWKIRNRKTGLEIKRHSFTEGWCVALNSLAELATLCLNEGMDYVALRRCGQDHLENLFACIRGRNGYNDRPEYGPF